MISSANASLFCQYASLDMFDISQRIAPDSAKSCQDFYFLSISDDEKSEVRSWNLANSDLLTNLHHFGLRLQVRGDWTIAELLRERKTTRNAWGLAVLHVSVARNQLTALLNQLAYTALNFQYAHRLGSYFHLYRNGAAYRNLQLHLPFAFLFVAMARVVYRVRSLPSVALVSCFAAFAARFVLQHFLLAYALMRQLGPWLALVLSLLE